jgi:uncharacterized integral membrane protein
MMQLALIIGILFAAVAVLFALQNNTQVVVTLAMWQFEGSLALVLILTLGMGCLIAGLVSTPAMIGRQWAVTRQNHQIRDLEKKLTEQESQNAVLRAQLAQLTPEPEAHAPAEKPYVGLKALFSGNADTRPKPDQDE